MDPLDAYMASLSESGAVSTAAAASPRRAVSDNRSYRGRQPHAGAAADVVVRNRRYTRLQQLLAEKPRGTDDWYFSDEMMQQRSPALFHLHLGQYLNVASRTQRAPMGADGVTLSTFLMDTCDRQVMEARRVAEQQTWGAFRSVDDRDDEQEDEEEEEEDVDEDEETKESEREASLSVADRRAQLIDLMGQRFLDGHDGDYVDYAKVDADEALDDIEQMQRDAEERYFDDDD